ncbi:restriction endonuclease subunit S [Acidithiobacillus caldus]
MKGKYPRYPAYKDSGVEWLGEVPEHWEVVPFKWLIGKNDGGVWGDEPDGSNDTVVLRSTEQTVDGRWKIDEPALRKLSRAEREASLLAEGDLLITKSSGSPLHIGKTSLVDADMASKNYAYSNFMQRIRLKSFYDQKLCWYVMNSGVARRQLELLSNTTTGLANLNGTIIGRMIMLLPPLSEQRAIAAFLDAETARIDALIAEYEKLIALLKEKRQALISHAVTKGLNPDVPMKDSGVEWLGEVPEHWDVCNLKRVITSITSGSRGWAEHYADDGDLFIRIGNLTRGSYKLNLSDTQFVQVPDDAEAQRAQVKPGDVLFSITAYLGSVAVADESIGMAYVSQHVALVRPDGTKVDPKWVGYVTLADCGQTYLSVQAYGGTKIQLSLDDVVNIPLPLPSLHEQQAIAAYLDTEAAKMDALILTVQSGIELLKERRTTLISDAVTGKFDVRGLDGGGIAECAGTTVMQNL